VTNKVGKGSVDSDYIHIFDTTLRDGEQSPGASMKIGEKVEVARQLEDLNVDVIEAVFAASSKGDFAAIEEVSQAVSRPVVLSLSRCDIGDVDQALKSVEGAKRPGIHIFIATSDLHLKYKLGIGREQALDAAADAVEHAKKHIDYIEFGCEDASRTDREFLAKIANVVGAAGADVITLADTVGYIMPEEMTDLIRYVLQATRYLSRLRWAVHCHDDLGLAVANSLAAIRAGVDQVQCTLTGIGERAGNCAMEELVMALKTRSEFFGITSRIDTSRLYPVALALANVLSRPIPPNKAIVGDNAFAHEAGIHQHGVLKNPLTYEIMKPEELGRPPSALVLGKHSGRHGFSEAVRRMGIVVDSIDMERLFTRFKALCDRKKTIDDSDIVDLVGNLEAGGAEAYRNRAVDLSPEARRSE